MPDSRVTVTAAGVSQSTMRHSIGVLVLLLASASGCRCGPDTPTAVTFRIKNPLPTALFVDASDERRGLKVMRNVGGEWIPFVESPRCECQACEFVCGGCACPETTPDPKVMKVEANGSAEREWSGFVQVSENAACPGTVVVEGPPCLNPE